MRKPTFFSALMIAFALASSGVTGATAETMTVDRSPDVLLTLDATNTLWGVVGVGDFNGDGVDDLLIQGIGPDRGRWIDLHFGPLESNVDGAADVTFQLAPGVELFPIAVADVNGDGRDDITFAHASRGVLSDFETVRVAIYFGREHWDTSYHVGQASRGDRKIEHRIPLLDHAQVQVASRVTPHWADLSDDGHLDLILAVDPPFVSTRQFSPGGFSETRNPNGNSRIYVSYGDSEWLFWSEGDPERGLPAQWEDRGFLRADVVVQGMGACERSFVGVGDVTGDGALDIVTRRCIDGLPDMVGILAGGEWQSTMSIAGAVPDRAPLEPVPPQRPEPPSNGGYLPPSGVRTPTNAFDFGPAAWVEDVDGDGVADVGLEFTDKTHLWHGGPDIAMRMVKMRTSGAMVRAGYGGSMSSGTWRSADLNGDGTRDLLVTLRPKLNLGGPIPQPRSLLTESVAKADPIHVYHGGLGGRAVLDVAGEAPDLMWEDADLGLWAIGDFNGDGFDDLVVGKTSEVQFAKIGVLYGPLAR